MSGTLLGVLIGSVAAPVLLKVLEWGLGRLRDRAEIRQIEQATDRDDVRMLLVEWKEIYEQQRLTEKRRHANLLENWLQRIEFAKANNDDGVCDQVAEEVRSHIAFLRLEHED